MSNNMLTISVDLKNRCRFCLYEYEENKPIVDIYVTKLFNTSVFDKVLDWLHGNGSKINFDGTTKYRHICIECLENVAKCISLKCLIEETESTLLLIKSNLFDTKMNICSIPVKIPQMHSVISIILDDCIWKSIDVKEIRPCEKLLALDPKTTNISILRKSKQERKIVSIDKNNIKDCCKVCLNIYDTNIMLDILYTEAQGKTILSVIRMLTSFRGIRVANPGNLEDDKTHDSPRKVCVHCLEMVVQADAFVEMICSTHSVITWIQSVTTKQSLDVNIEHPYPKRSFEKMLSNWSLLMTENETLRTDDILRELNLIQTEEVEKEDQSQQKNSQQKDSTFCSICQDVISVNNDHLHDHILQHTINKK